MRLTFHVAGNTFEVLSIRMYAISSIQRWLAKLSTAREVEQSHENPFSPFGSLAWVAVNAIANEWMANVGQRKAAPLFQDALDYFERMSARGV